MIILQLIGWCVVLGSSLFWSVNPGLDKFDLVMFLIHLVPLIFIYVINYTIIIPKVLFKNKFKSFVFINTILIMFLMLLSYHINMGEALAALKPYAVKKPRNSNPVFLARDLINYITMAGLVTAVRMVGRFRQNEEALKVAERERVKSELANLRSQINPHFLLNTLNNIYSLTIIDVDKAQKAIQELSRLLQYVLYDNTTDKVPLQKELGFIKNYIELMRIRLNPNVKLTVEINVSDTTSTQIAPLIFISLIENAFKHGVGAGKDSFISINFEDMTDKGEVILTIVNSNHAKSDNDKSGSGIGLEQVRKRLDLQYKDAYGWEIENNTDIYSSKLTLKV
ncbi:MAG: sensor histidine kinase [Rikenellaceae bacterium]